MSLTREAVEQLVLGHGELDAMEQRLGEADWLAADRPTVADLACYPYVALAGEEKFSLEPYPAVRAWLKRVEELPGWVPTKD